MDNPSKKHVNQLRDVSLAYRREYEKQVVDNEALQAEIRIFQKSYGFPIQDFMEGVRWIDRNQSKYFELSEAIDELLTKFEVNKRWRLYIQNLIIYDRTTVFFPTGLPTISGSSEKSKSDIIVTPDVDITNPIVQDFIIHFQHKYDPLPRPEPAKDNPRKLDWFPLWSWHMRHPDVGLKEIAKEINLSYNYVRTKMAAMEKEYEPES